jgi:hypothetical protein
MSHLYKDFFPSHLICKWFLPTTCNEFFCMFIRELGSFSHSVLYPWVLPHSKAFHLIWVDYDLHRYALLQGHRECLKSHPMWHWFYLLCGSAFSNVCVLLSSLRKNSFMSSHGWALTSFSSVLQSLLDVRQFGFVFRYGRTFCLLQVLISMHRAIIVTYMLVFIWT